MQTGAKTDCADFSHKSLKTFLTNKLVEISDLVDKFGTRVSIFGQSPPDSRSRFPNGPPKDFQAFVNASRVVLYEPGTRKAIPLSKSPVIESLNPRPKSAKNDDFSFWHYDRSINGYLLLGSRDLDYSDQPLTRFADLGDVASHLQKCIPRFLLSLEANFGLDPFAYSGNRNSEQTFDRCFNLLKSYHSDLTQADLWILRDASWSFLDIMDDKGPEYVVNDFKPFRFIEAPSGIQIQRSSTILNFSYLIEHFQGIRQVADFLMESSEVPNSYTHQWRPNQILVWAGDDCRLLHARIPQKIGIEMAPLYRATLQYPRT